MEQHQRAAVLFTEDFDGGVGVRLGEVKLQTLVRERLRILASEPEPDAGPGEAGPPSG